MKANAWNTGDFGPSAVTRQAVIRFQTFCGSLVVAIGVLQCAGIIGEPLMGAVLVRGFHPRGSDFWLWFARQ